MKIFLTVCLLIFACIMPTEGKCDLEQGLIAHYPFLGSANDFGGNGNNGAVNGPVLASDRFGISNRAYDFDGSNDTISVPDSSSLRLTNAITIAAWVRVDGYATDRGIISKRYGEKGFSLWINTSGKLLFGVGNTSFGGIVGNATIPATTWVHLVGTYDNVDMKSYINGKLDGSVVRAGQLDYTTVSMYLGALLNQSGQATGYFDGVICDLRVYNRALSSYEIVALAGGNQLGADYNLDGIVDLDDVTQKQTDMVSDFQSWFNDVWGLAY